MQQQQQQQQQQLPRPSSPARLASDVSAAADLPFPRCHQGLCDSCAPPGVTWIDNYCCDLTREATALLRRAKSRGGSREEVRAEMTERFGAEHAKGCETLGAYE